MPSSVSLGCLLFLSLVTQSLSLCVIKQGTNSKCTDSSFVLVSQSQLETDNGLNLTIKELPFVHLSGNCTTANEEKHVYAFMGKRPLDYEFLDINNTTMKIQIPRDATIGLHIISFTFQITHQDCYDAIMRTNREITLKVMKNPVLHQNSDTLYCIIDYDSDCWWVVFKMNSEEVGYCNLHTTSPIKYRKDISIYYDAQLGHCNLKTSKNEGTYLCSVTYDNGTALNSNNIRILKSGNNNILIGVLVPVGSIIIIIIIIIIAIIAGRKKKWLCFRGNNNYQPLHDKNDNRRRRAS